MNKLKYYSLSKEEKYLLKEEFYNTQFGINIKKILNRLLLTGVTGLFFSIYLLIDKSNIMDLIISIILFITSLIFIISSYKIRINKLNNYLIKKS